MKKNAKSVGRLLSIRLDDIDNRLDRILTVIIGGGATTIMFLLGLISTIVINNWS